MPQKKFMKSRRKKSVKKTRFGYKPVNVSRGVRQGFPKIMTMKHRYVDTVEAPSVSGALYTRQYHCNAMTVVEEPVGGSHQPYYFDQMTALYDHYTVIGSTIKITFVPLSDTVVPMSLALWINDDPTIVGGIEAIQERGRNIRLTTYGSEKPYILKSSWSLKKAFGKGGTLANSALRGSSSANPTEVQLYAFTVQSVDETTTTTGYAQVELSYIAVWNELKDIARS